jgi:hypothetical protein
VEGLELIIAALAAGAAAGASDVAGAAVRDSYAKLREVVRRKAPDAGVDAADGAGSPEFVRALKRSGAAEDPEILKAARRVLKSSGGAHMRIGSVEIKDSTGIIVGDDGTMTVHITDRPRKRR